MAKRLYVGNLKYTVTSADLQELFEQFGTVSGAQVLSDRETGRSRGFGFVEMDNDDEALAAIESLDGQDHDGRRLTVNECDRGRRAAAVAAVATAAAVAAATAAAVAAVTRTIDGPPATECPGSRPCVIPTSPAPGCSRQFGVFRHATTRLGQIGSSPGAAGHPRTDRAGPG